jgi:hypothetical protein
MWGEEVSEISSGSLLFAISDNLLQHTVQTGDLSVRGHRTANFASLERLRPVGHLRYADLRDLSRQKSAEVLRAPRRS